MPAAQSYRIRLSFTRKTADFGSIFVPERCCTASVLKVNRHISNRAFVHTQKTDFGSIFVPERCCAASVLKVNRHISDTFS